MTAVERGLNFLFHFVKSQGPPPALLIIYLDLPPERKLALFFPLPQNDLVKPSSVHTFNKAFNVLVTDQLTEEEHRMKCVFRYTLTRSASMKGLTLQTVAVVSVSHLKEFILNI